jgi:cytochrome P450
MSEQVDTPPQEGPAPPSTRRRLRRQLVGRTPFEGDIRPTRVRLLRFGSGRPTLPFPHPWNYHDPLAILETYFWGADAEEGSGRHSRYLDVPGFAPVLVTRDPRLIRAISVETAAKPGQFDRDTMPSAGIARATGRDTLLYANGPAWKRQKQLSTPPFSRGSLFQPEQFGEFEATFRRTVEERLGALRARLEREGEPVRVALEPEIKAVMLEMLVRNFFGADVSREEIRERFVPALERVIDDIVLDTVVNKFGVPLARVPNLTRRIARAKTARADFERLTDLALSGRRERLGQWGHFESDAPDESLRSNIRVFLAGALEATTSYASWALSHLSRNLAAQDRLYEEVNGIDAYTPEALRRATYLEQVLDETLRLTPALYFHPRRPTVDTWVETLSGERLLIPAGTHVLLDVWHANRHEDHWGVAVTGHPAEAFVPERWKTLAACPGRAKEMLHFGFGHGPRFCPGKHLGQLEVALVVGAVVKLFRLEAVAPGVHARAGVSTRPGDGALVDLRLRARAPACASAAARGVDSTC